MNTSLETQSERSTSNIWISGLIGWALAFVGVLILFGTARLFGVTLQVGTPPDWTTLIPLPIAQLISATFVPAAVATVLYVILRLVFKYNATRIFWVIAVIALLLSFGGPLSLAVSTVNKIILALMHVVTTVAIVWALTLRK